MKKWLRKDTAVALMFLLPSGLGFAIFYFIPFVKGIMYSFQNNAVQGQFVGLDNYRELLDSDSFRKAFLHTTYFTVISVPILIVLSLGIAILLNKNIYCRNLLRTAYVLPLVVPTASIVLIWQILFDWNGSLNAWLGTWMLERVDWMKTDAARYVIIGVYIWKNIGYNMILFLAGLQQIPKDYYETAYIEGAGRLRQFRSITLVYLTPTMFFVVLMSIMNSFKVFRETYLVAGEYPHDSIYMLQHYMNNMFVSLDIQKLTAAASLMAACILVIVLGMYFIERRVRHSLD